jgi:UDP-glucuronate 4-epimerase
MKILITGIAGFIGFSLAKTLLDKNHIVYGIDNINNYYDVKLKKKRLFFLKDIYKKKFKFNKIDISNTKNINSYFVGKKFDKVFHLAAQAGVRYSLFHPEKYLDSNLIGFSNIIFNCKKKKIKDFIYASSSSVYGANKKVPYKESDKVSSPLQYYAATKISNEAIAESYSRLYKIRCTGLRFFTVYGPWGRPDMALFKFVKNIFNNKSINIYNRGYHYRDFTYIDDVIYLTIKISESKKFFNKKNYHRILNIGTGNPEPLKKYLNIIENKIGKRAKVKNLEIQKGDMVKTYACVKKLKKIVNIKNRINLEKGISNFVEWYKDYHKLKHQ